MLKKGMKLTSGWLNKNMNKDFKIKSPAMRTGDLVIFDLNLPILLRF